MWYVIVSALLTLLAGYIILSLCLLHCCPALPWTKNGQRRRTELILMRKPTQPRQRLSRDAQSLDRMWCIAHRGGSLCAPENTMLAFRRAVYDYHCDMLELDVFESADGIPVVSHDGDLGRICGSAFAGKTINADVMCNSGEMPRLASKIPLHFAAGPEVQHYEMSAADVKQHGPQPLCSLEEVFREFSTHSPDRQQKTENYNTGNERLRSDICIHIDIKDPVRAASLVPAVIQLVNKYRRGSSTVVGSMLTATSALIRKEQRSMVKKHNEKRKQSHAETGRSTEESRAFSTCSGIRQVAIVYALYYVGLLPFVSIDTDVFDIPFPTKELTRQFRLRLVSSGHATLDELKRRETRPRAGIASCLCELVFSCLCCCSKSKKNWRFAALDVALGLLAAPGLFKHLRRRGVRVLTWVHNTEGDFNDLFDQDAVWSAVDGVMTDDPPLFQRWRQEKIEQIV